MCQNNKVGPSLSAAKVAPRPGFLSPPAAAERLVLQRDLREADARMTLALAAKSSLRRRSLE